MLLEHLSRLGIGISSFVSLGDKDDVSGKDMLLWWESDPATKLAVLYLESFGNPREFARTTPPRPYQAGSDRERGPVGKAGASPQPAPPQRWHPPSPGRPCSSRQA